MAIFFVLSTKVDSSSTKLIFLIYWAHHLSSKVIFLIHKADYLSTKVIFLICA